MVLTGRFFGFSSARSLASAAALSSLLACSSTSTTKVVGGSDAAGGSPPSSGGSSGSGPSSGGAGGQEGSGGSAGSSAAGAGGAAADAGADAGPTLCGTYCAAVMENCKGDLAVYTSPEVCAAVCEKLPAGTAGDTSGNTVECRITNAKLAGTTGEPDTHCPIAGPGGNDACGENCEGYCAVMMEACPDEFVSLTACKQACAGVTDLGGYASSQTSGDTVQCRLYHSNAATIAPSVHCVHAAGAPPCG